MSSGDAFAVQGEAQESDEEQQDFVKYGKAVDGEAPESDDELVSFRKALPSNCEIHPINFNESNITEVHFKESVLKRKLCETNTSLWKNLNFLLQNSILPVSKQLIDADQQLLKSQVTLQAASYSLKESNVITKKVLNRTRDLVSTNFIPAIKM